MGLPCADHVADQNLFNHVFPSVQDFTRPAQAVYTISDRSSKFNKVYRYQLICYNEPDRSTSRRGMKMDQTRNPIGVFDSGIGGISTLR